MISEWKNKEIYLTAFLFATSRRFTDDELATSEYGQRESGFNALMQFCLLNALIWVLLILLQATHKEIFYYKRDITAVVFETRSPTEAFKIVPHRTRDSFTQTEIHVMKYDMKRREGVYKRRERRLRRRFTHLRTQLACSYGELARTVDKDRQRLSEEKKLLATQIDIRDKLQLQSDSLSDGLTEKVHQHLDLKARYQNCFNAVSGNKGFVEEVASHMGCGDFVIKPAFSSSPVKKRINQQRSTDTEEWI